METTTQTITILIVLYQVVTKILADKSKLINIPYIMSGTHFTNSSKPIEISCQTIDQKKSLIHIIEFFLEGKKLNNKRYFKQYLYWFRFLGIYNPLKFFDLSYYEKINWSKYNEYISYLNNDYEKIFLTVQLITYCDIESRFLNGIFKKFHIKQHWSETNLTIILHELIGEAFYSKIYDNLFQLLMKQGLCSNIKESLRNFALSPMISKMISSELSEEEIKKIIGNTNGHKENNLLGFILMRRYILQNKIEEAIKIFIEVKTCNNELFEHLFSLSNDEQREVLLQNCRTQNKFESNNRNTDCIRHYVLGIYLSVDEEDNMLDSVTDSHKNKVYDYNSELMKYVQK